MSIPVLVSGHPVTRVRSGDEWGVKGPLLSLCRVPLSSVPVGSPLLRWVGVGGHSLVEGASPMNVLGKDTPSVPSDRRPDVTRLFLHGSSLYFGVRRPLPWTLARWRGCHTLTARVGSVVVSGWSGRKTDWSLWSTPLTVRLPMGRRDRGGGGMVAGW